MRINKKKFYSIVIKNVVPMALLEICTCKHLGMLK